MSAANHLVPTAVGVRVRHATSMVWVVKWVRRTTGQGVRVVAIDGPSGSGKTTLARALHRTLKDATVISLDAHYPGWDGLLAGVTEVGRHALLALYRGGVGSARGYDWEHSSPGQRQFYRPGRVLIVEGCGAAAAIASLPVRLRRTIWCQMPDPIRKARALERDGDVFTPHWDRWERQWRRYVYRYTPRRGIAIELSLRDGAAREPLPGDPG